MKEVIRTLIVDDEALARDGVRIHLQQQPDFEVVGEAEDGTAAVNAIRELDPDVVFLDVQMPGLDGFGVLRELGAAALPEIVFVTAYDQFALQAFEAHALDYLLKPFDAERFGASLDRVRRQLTSRRRASVDDRLAALLADLDQRPQFLERVAVRSGSRIVILRTADIDWIEAAANYVKLHANGRSYLLRETMSGIERSLDPERFLRIHRSTIVNLDRVRELEPLFQGDYLVLLQDGTRLTSSRGYRDNMQRLLG